MWKLKNYRAHPAIEEYIVVDLQSLKIESYHKEQNSPGFHFALADAYIEVEFEETTAATNL